MLKLLTGEAQSGKTRWLQREVEMRTAAGSDCYGVITPGIWRRQTDAPSGQTSYEKLGIEALLLPEGKRIPFACRHDLKNVVEDTAPSQQSDRARLGWAISDAALDAVNRHFDALSRQVAAAAAASSSAAGAAAYGHAAPPTAAPAAATNPAVPGLLVVDELGPLELEHRGGFSSAVQLLLAGPTWLWPDALIVVRPRLVNRARELFQAAWGSAKLCIEPPVDHLRPSPSI
ncbi:MAG: hypothetical protein LBP28_01360 [Coriobacteriales bacterium]|nr:hypothetical protein [Coriobacteriales bacterium]